ncbi:hypothetical protein HAX54_016824 [Datura stramonium]|uniref:Uncharacterized protein n=1 Tax=Datura stramonium TaxID=4076 RepID=A0ABS8ULX8_DATST|nr:hypothetical protein [Datura stramonium]
MTHQVRLELSIPIESASIMIYNFFGNEEYEVEKEQLERRLTKARTKNPIIPTAMVESQTLIARDPLSDEREEDGDSSLEE